MSCYAGSVLNSLSLLKTSSTFECLICVRTLLACFADARPYIMSIGISEASVAKYMVRSPKPPSQTWRTFLNNHVSQLASIDFFTVHTVWFEILFVFIVLAHDRRRVVHFNVTTHPTAEWTAQQMLEAFPFDKPPRYY